MKLIILFLLWMTFSIFAQIEIRLPEQFMVNVNDSTKNFQQSWYDSLHFEANNSKIYYEIVGYESSNRISTAKLKIPQILKINEVIRQVIFYYSLLAGENEREKEKVLTYPFFANIHEPESISCTYSNHTFYFELKSWKTLPEPEKPTPEEKNIYNQIMKYALENTLIFGSVPNKAIEEISRIKNMPINEINEVYKKVILWNVGR